jgi:glycosyltransferase involved in cell wall biosynthesis
MRVLYDYQAFAAQRAGGVSRYFTELMREWGRQEAVEAEVLAPLSINQHLRDARRGGVPGICGRQAPCGWGPHPALSLANRLGFWAATQGRSWDLYHPTYYNTLRPCPCFKKNAVTVFDMAHERFPGLFRGGDPTSRRKRLMLERADGIICISEATRRELVALWGEPGARVEVIPLATRIGAVAAVPFAHPRPYWLYVGMRGGYKDFAVLLDAWAETRALAETDVVCFGGGPFDPAERRELDRRGLASRVHQLPGDDAVLRGLYEAALALVYPSRYEGFGLPPLEAMTTGCPVIAADGGSVPEVVGPGGLLFPAGRVEALSGALQKVMADGTLRRSLVDAGFRQAKLFSWEATAERTRQFYGRVLG